MVDLDEELRSLYLEREKVDGLNDDDQFGQLNIDQVDLRGRCFQVYFETGVLCWWIGWQPKWYILRRIDFYRELIRSA